MAEVPLSWKLSVSGGGQVKSVLSDLRSAFQRGQIDAIDYADSLNKISNEVNKVNNISRSQSRIFLAMHPIFNKTSRALSTMASVSRTLLTVMNAVNIARLVAQGNDSTSIDLTNQLAEAHRTFNRELDPLKKQEAAESISFLTAKLKEHQEQVNYDKIANGIILFSSGLLGLQQGLKIIQAVATAGVFTSLAYGISLLGAASVGGVIGLAPLIAIVAMLTLGFLFLGAALEKFRGEDGVFSAIIDPMVEMLGLREPLYELGRFFAETLPDALLQTANSFKTLWLNILKITEDAINIIVGGVQELINSIISVINTLITAYNKIASKLGLGKISLLKTVSFEKVDLTGNSSNNQASPIQGSSGGSIGPSNTYITVQGSVLSERELTGIIDSYNKDQFKNAGFTGFQ